HRLLCYTVLLFGAWAVLAASGTAQQDWLTPEQVVQGHLNSLGSPESRANARTRACEGICRLELLKGGFGAMNGPAVYVAEGERQALEIHFGDSDYPREALSYTGTEVQAARVLPGQRSRLGEFLAAYPQLMSEGLFGGVYGTGWPLLDVKGNQPRLQYRGVTKKDGKKVHRLDYESGGDRRDVNVALFFDEKTFRHVRSEYTLTVRNGMRTDPTQPLGALDAYTRYELAETFSEFRRTDGLHLPFRWSIRLTTESDAGQELGGRSFVWEWKLKFDRIQHNLQINPELFEVE
ncbi:MAG: hypothetical protein ACRD6I_11060, partial [Candidatus Acidiferrales bacterium]